VSELTGLQLEDLSLSPQASILVRGKGRKRSVSMTLRHLTTLI
jgi:site-specific recombinase XerC